MNSHTYTHGEADRLTTADRLRHSISFIEKANDETQQALALISKVLHSLDAALRAVPDLEPGTTGLKVRNRHALERMIDACALLDRARTSVLDLADSTNDRLALERGKEGPTA